MAVDDAEKTPTAVGLSNEEPLPEVEVYLRLIVLLALIDSKLYNAVRNRVLPNHWLTCFLLSGYCLLFVIDIPSPDHE